MTLSIIRELSNIKSEMNNVSVPNNVVPAFQPPLAGFPGSGLSITSYEIVITDNFGPNKALLKIGMYDTGRRWSARSLFNCPGPCFPGSGA